MMEDFSRYNGGGTELRRAQERLLEMLVEFDRICKKHDISYFLSGGSCLGAVRHKGFIPWDDDVDIDVWHTDYKRLERILPNELSAGFAMQTPKTDRACYRFYMKIVDKNSYVKYPDNRRRETLEHKGLAIDVLPLRPVFSFKLKSVIDRFYRPAFSVVKTQQANSRFKLFLSYLLWPTMAAFADLARLVDWLFSKSKVSHDYGTGMTPKLMYAMLFPTCELSFEGYMLSGPAKPHEYLQELYGNYLVIPPVGSRESHAEIIRVR